MKAEELRIGNLVQWNKLASMVTGETVVGTLHFQYTQFLEPIPLTEEWLLKFGFVNDGVVYWIDLEGYYLELVPVVDGYLYPIYVQCPEVSNEEEQRVSLNRIKYVHQLQNLYYALTGSELTLKQ